MKKPPKLVFVLALVLLLGQFVLQLYLAKADSQTTDEGVHLSSGYTYLTKGDFRFNPEHPPLIKMLAATPLLFLTLKTPPDAQYFDRAVDYHYDSWLEARVYGEDWLYTLGNNPNLMLWLGRLPMIFMTLLFGLAIFLISQKLWGDGGGLLSLALYTFDPLIAAHGHLITTDIGVSLGYLLTIYTFWLFLHKKNWRNAIFFGLAFGLAQLTKFTAVILLPAIAVLFLYFIAATKASENIVRTIGKIIVAFLISFIVIWAGYGFKIPGIMEYFKGLAMVIGHTEGGHSSFLLGQISKTGWWYYFPVVFSAKTTIPALIIFSLILILILRQKKDRRKRLFFLLGALVWLAAAMVSKADIGLRHIMPIYGLLFVLAGMTVESFWLETNWRQVCLAGLLIWLIAEFALAFPYYMSYYNQFYGGTANGYKIATDSNYDWGQDLKRVQKYLAENQIKNPWVEYDWDGEKALDYYGISRRPVETFDLNQPGFLVIEATALQTYKPYRDLRDAPIYARITPSVFLFKIK